MRTETVKDPGFCIEPPKTIAFEDLVLGAAFWTAKHGSAIKVKCEGNFYAMNVHSWEITTVATGTDCTPLIAQFRYNPEPIS